MFYASVSAVAVELRNVMLTSATCAMQFGVFLFFAAFVAIMTVYVWILLPETKGIPVEEIMDAWAR